MDCQAVAHALHPHTGRNILGIHDAGEMTVVAINCLNHIFMYSVNVNSNSYIFLFAAPTAPLPSPQVRLCYERGIIVFIVDQDIVLVLILEN